jgi:hypothetical protein
VAKEKVNREKIRLAKIAAIQAKASAQSAKLRAEQVAESGTGKVDETPKDVKLVAIRGGRGGKPSGKGKGIQRNKEPQRPEEMAPSEPAAESSTIEPEPLQTAPDFALLPEPPRSPAAAAATNVSGSQGFRGRGGRRARARGVYRTGGRGGRRGSNLERPAAASVGDG